MGGGSVQLLLYEKNVPLQWISVASRRNLYKFGRKGYGYSPPDRVHYDQSPVREQTGSVPDGERIGYDYESKTGTGHPGRRHGQRFGGLKQLTPVGPGGEMIIDYSIHDAIRAGFGKIVFVIKHEIEEEFKEKIGRRHRGEDPGFIRVPGARPAARGIYRSRGAGQALGTGPRRPLLPGRGGWALHGDQRGRFLRPELLPSARGIFGPAPVGFRKAPYRYGGLHPGKHPDRERQRLPGDLLCG